MDLAKQLQLALDHQNAGRLAEAEALYRQIIIAQPKHADALHLLGVLAAQVGRFDVAHDLIRRAIAINPSVAQYHYNLGNALRDRKLPDEAITAYRQALLLNPNYAEVHNNLGNVLRGKGQLDDAIASFHQAIRLNPNYLDAHLNIGVALGDKKQVDDAIAAYRHVLRLDQDHVKALYNLGIALNEKGLNDEAVVVFRHAIRLKPNYAEAYNNLSIALDDLGQYQDAVAALRQTLRLKPDYAEAHHNLGRSLNNQKLLDEAIASYEEALRLKPDLAEAHSSLGGALLDTGQLDRAIASFRRGIELDHDEVGGHSNLLFALHVDPAGDPKSILAEHRNWANRHALPLASLIKPHTNDRSPRRRLRIGYVSGDFRGHSVAFFLEPLLQHHDPENFEIFAYSNVQHVDAFTDRMKSCCKVWRDIVSMTDDAAASLIRSDGIDILVDLSGHTAGSRLLIFARKPAPVQVTYLGYPDTTGLPAIDYRFTDAWADPPGMTDDLNVEKLCRLPKCNWCYQPRPDAPEIQPRSSGPITFGCFSGLAKINPTMVLHWAELLKRVPESRLMLKSVGAGWATPQQRLRDQFAMHGIPTDRLIMLGWAEDQRRHLEIYQQIDIALDTYPYHGTTTTCEALWMSIPVVTLAGQTHASRVGVSLLTNVGVPELIAQTPEQYVHLAAELASDPDRLSHLRSTLRQRMANSPLLDARGLARDVESAYRRMWENWCSDRL